jgi:formate hydrogenlyase subunit 3/multisubunit Na+/H+ antiporter MnhD subunit
MPARGEDFASLRLGAGTIMSGGGLSGCRTSELVLSATAFFSLLSRILSFLSSAYLYKLVDFRIRNRLLLENLSIFYHSLLVQCMIGKALVVFCADNIINLFDAG